jgi:hypothetical protein
MHLFDVAPAIVVQFGAITLSTSPISKLRGADDERRQAKRQPCRQAHGRSEDPLAIALTAAASAWRSTAA